MTGVLFGAYGAVSYLIFFATFLYAIGFVADLVVPKSIDSEPAGPLGAALLTDAVLVAIFALQHSVMARQGFKAVWTKIVPKPLERSTFVLAASAALLLLFWKWEPIGGVFWQVDGEPFRLLLKGLSFAGWMIVLVSTFLIDHFDLFGLKQVFLFLRGLPYTPVQFTARGWYGYVRHPIYLGFIVAFWATPTMTIAHLVFAVATTAYILVAIQLEERDMVRAHGARYEAYREQVSMLVPRPPKKTRALRSGAHLLLIAGLTTGVAYAEKKVTVCHVPHGNPSNSQTISVGEAAVSAHLGHGDQIGACPSGCLLNASLCDDGNACTSDSCGANGECHHAPVSCDDGNPCTADLCDAQTGCYSVANEGATCDDQNACTQNDACAGTVCRGTSIPGCCATSAECDDGNACTIDSCRSGSCANEPRDCTVAAKCLAGFCDANGACATAPVSGDPACNFCGDGLAQSLEGCDGQDLKGQTCETIFAPGWLGTLHCSTSCQLDTSGCLPPDPGFDD